MLSNARSQKTIRSYFAYSVAATATVLAIPLSIMWIASQVDYLQIPLGLTASMAVAFMALGTAVGSKVWEGAAASEDISFSELMLWSWYRLAHADQRIADFRIAAEKVDSSPEQQLALLQELGDALEDKDPYTRGHSARVERHAFNTGAAMGLTLKEIDVLRKAASLHDVGKMRIPNRVLHKKGPLNEDERALIEEHPVLGAWMVSAIGDEQIVSTVRHHHERWDGKGYPDQISGYEIPLFARIIAVADTFDAVTSTRSYRAGSSRKRGIEILKVEAGRQFDPHVVEVLVATLPRRSGVLTALLVFVPASLRNRMVQWVRRFGNGTLAPALSAIGAAIVVTTGVFLGAPEASDPTLQGSSLTTGSAADSRLGFEPRTGSAATISSEIAPIQVLGTRMHRARSKGSSGGDEQASTGTGTGTDAGSSAPSDSTAPSTRKTRDDRQQTVAAPTNDAPAPAPVTASQPSPTLNDTLESVDDPKALVGDDCDGLGGANKGVALHCD